VPRYEIGSKTFDISRAAVIADSNLFIEAFMSGAPRHAEARYFLDEFDDQWLIPIGVIVETWGFMVGKGGDWLAGYNFLGWLNTPGKDLIIIGHDGEMAEERVFIEGLRLDCVDAMIVNLATNIFNRCALEQPLPVATFDTRDFFRLGGRKDIRLRVYDLNELIVQDLS
jgi:hypothetical protein